MTFFGVQESVAAELVRRLSADDVGGASMRDRFALAAWSGVAEPGDRTAGALVRALGPSPALQALLDREEPSRVADRARASGADVTDSDVAEAFGRWTPRLHAGGSVLALQQAVRFGMRLVTPDDDAWPTQLDDLGDHAPRVLWARGDVGRLAALRRSIALVGARAATSYGETVAVEASAGLVDRGFAIVSGAAYGIDGAAHRAALASSGLTVAVLAGGLDRFYPLGHETLLEHVVRDGAAVAEVPPGTPPTKWRFLQRNRVIAALSAATVVLEAGVRSGSLNTAGHAAALGRALGAVPGPVTSPASAGCHRLVREYGAELVTTPREMAQLVDGPDDLAATLPGLDRVGPAGDGGGDVVRVLDALSDRAARSADDLARRAGLAPATVRSVLGVLALEGRVTERERGWVRRRG